MEGRYIGTYGCLGYCVHQHYCAPSFDIERSHMKANMNAGIFRRYRWKELGLLIIPFVILVLEMVQLAIAQFFQTQITTNSQQSIPISTAILPSIRDLVPVPVFGLRNMNWLKRYKYTWA